MDDVSVGHKEMVPTVCECVGKIVCHFQGLESFVKLIVSTGVIGSL